MELLPLRHDQVLVHRLPRERVPELEFARRPLILLEQLVSHTCLERRVDRRLVHAGDRDERGDVGRPADHRSGRQNVDLVFAQSLEPVQNCRPHIARDAHLGQGLTVPAGRGAEDVAAVDRVPKHLLDHERVALAALL